MSSPIFYLPPALSLPVTTPAVAAGSIDHQAAVLARLPTQWQNSPNLIALMLLFAQRYQDLETVFQAVLTSRSVYTANDNALDLLGKLVGQPRNGLDNDTYRRYILAKIATNRSNGTIEDLIRVALLILNTPGVYVHLDNQGTGACVLRVESTPVTDAIANVLVDFEQKAAAAGVRVILETQYTADSDTQYFAIMTSLSGGTAIGATTIPVGSTAGFPATGALYVDQGVAGADLAVSYTGTTPTSFIGVTGLASTHSSGAEVVLASGPGLGLGDTSNGATGGEMISARDTHYP